jgi:hypothetical protein
MARRRQTHASTANPRRQGPTFAAIQLQRVSGEFQRIKTDGLANWGAVAKGGDSLEADSRGSYEVRKAWFAGFIKTIE